MSRSIHFTKTSWIHWIFDEKKFYHRWFWHLGKKCIGLEYGFCKNFGISMHREEWNLKFHIGLYFFSAWLTLSSV